MKDTVKTIVPIAYDALDEKLAKDIEIIKISHITIIADYLIIASATNTSQMNALVDYVDEKLSEAGFKSSRKEGKKDSSWILLDYGDVIVHFFLKEERLFYDLERLWKDGIKVKREQFDLPKKN